MKLLVLGGTMFLGRHFVTAALAHGHELTLFHRGKTNPDLFPEVEKLHGDRKQSLEPLAGRRFDAVIDTCGYFPRAVQMVADTLGDRVGHYTFISSISVYADMRTVGQDETAPLAQLADETTEEITGETYGGLKALCEAAAAARFPDRALILRPGLITGPNDPSDRFTYWPVRIARGGDVLAPPAETLVQHIDARDLAEWMLALIEAQQTGVYNATGPEPPLTMRDVLENCRQATGSDARFMWASEAFLLQHEVAPFSELPLWVPEEESGMLAVSVERAVAAGLRFRPLAETVRDTLAWHAGRAGRGAEAQSFALRSGLKPEREAELIAAWRSRNA